MPDNQTTPIATKGRDNLDASTSYAQSFPNQLDVIGILQALAGRSERISSGVLCAEYCRIAQARGLHKASCNEIDGLPAAEPKRHAKVPSVTLLKNL